MHDLDNKFITFLGALLILFRSGLIYLRDNGSEDILHGEYKFPYDYEMDFSGKELRMAFVRELAGKIRSVSVMPGSIILVGTYICSTIGRSYRYLSYLYEGFHVENDTIAAFNRVNEIINDTNIVTEAIKAHE